MFVFFFNFYFEALLLFLQRYSGITGIDFSCLDEFSVVQIAQVPQTGMAPLVMDLAHGSLPVANSQALGRRQGGLGVVEGEGGRASVPHEEGGGEGMS